MKDGESETRGLAEAEKERDESVRSLVSASLRGDPAAGAELYLRYRDYLAAAVAPRIPSDLASLLDLEDLLQSAFLSAFVALPRHRFVDERRFRAWMREIAVNKLRDRLRRLRQDAQGRSAAGGVEDGEPLDDSGDSPSAILARAENEARLRQALAELAPDLRRAIQMRCFERRTWTQIAAALGTSDDGARRRYRDAVEGLEKRLR